MGSGQGGLKLFLNLVCETCKERPNPNSEGSSSLYVHTCLTACTEMSCGSTTELCAKIVFLHVSLWVSTAQHQKSHSYAVSAHDTGKCYQKAHSKGQEELSEGTDLITEFQSSPGWCQTPLVLRMGYSTHSSQLASKC